MKVGGFSTNYYDMNKKEELLRKIVDIVIECCDFNGTVTREKVIGKCKEENCVMTRCLLVNSLIRAGFTITTCASLMGLTAQSTRMLMTRGSDYQACSSAYRHAKADITEQIAAIVQD